MYAASGNKDNRNDIGASYEAGTKRRLDYRGCNNIYK